ncbi:DUF4380 domain-containing protein [Rubripirellula amarantea]|nr:DUF4380 domain-containing protein [Rubripirellula amarantea]
MKKITIACLWVALVSTTVGWEKSKVLADDQSQYLTLQLNSLRLAVDPNLGGRIVSFSLDGIEVLRTTRDEKNLQWGSTAWSSPQSDWNWPPLETLDSEPYVVRSHSADAIELASGIDETTKLQMIKHFQMRMGSNGAPLAVVSYRIANRGLVDTKVAVWENTRVDWGGFTEFSAGSQIRLSHPEKSVVTEDRNGVTRLAFNGMQPHAQKVFVTPAEVTNSKGERQSSVWNRYHRHDLVLIKRCELLADTAPGQTPLEIYLAPQSDFAELELQGPYESLAPNEEVSLVVHWQLFKTEDPRIEDLRQ